MKSALLPENSFDKATTSFGQAQNLAEHKLLSHDQQLRKQCLARIANPGLNEILINSTNGIQAHRHLIKNKINVTNLDAGETPLTWIHALYLSITCR